MLMCLVMVWHGRRRLVAMEERLTAMEEVQRISQENLRLLEQQRRFLQDASHELGTPITVALGHVELIEQAVTDQVVAEDARVVAEELSRLRRLAHRRRSQKPTTARSGSTAPTVAARRSSCSYPPCWRQGP